jgi:hypothetical protein
MQVTLTHDSTPALYEALAGLAARRRVDRVKDLAKLGLLVERAGLHLAAGHRQESVTGAMAGAAPQGTTATLLDWTDDDDQ